MTGKWWDTSTEIDPSRGPAGEAAPTYVVSVVQGPDAGARLVLDAGSSASALVGKGPACELRLTDPLVSRRHLSLEVTPRGVRVADLGSTNGTLVGGIAIGEAFVRGGERVRLGDTALLVDRGDPSRAAPSAAVRFGRMFGASPAMRGLYPLCARLAASAIPVLIEGETGTGKEVLAEALHEASPRAQAPFVVFDCTAVPPSLVESTLFGHERGAFTGAVGPRAGVFEEAHGGTLLIDEIGDLDLPLQPKLLRAIERSEIRRVGGDRPIRVDVRVLAATRRDLDREVQAGRFRDDLFHRLAVARIELPPLRHRAGDVQVLARHFWRALGGKPEELPGDLLLRWEDDAWKGNVRELRNTVARRLALGELAPTGPAAHGATAHEGAPGDDFLEGILRLGLPLIEARQRMIEEFERRYIDHTLERHGGSVGKAATAAGVAKRHFQRIKARGKPE
jgi:DNA-binding NtrC family response regulator